MYLKSFLFASVMAGILIGCGSSGDSVDGVSVEGGADEIIISTKGHNTIRKPQPNSTVKITGSNNLVTLKSKPKQVIILGDDNHLKTPVGTKVKDEGDGNQIEYQR